MLKPLQLNQVKIKDSFWTSRIDRLRDTIIPYQYEVLNDRVPGLEPSHALENLRIAAGLSQGEFKGMVFQDSDVWKWLEAVGHLLATHPDRELEAKADAVIDIIAKAQTADGYLDTYYILNAPDKKWTNLREDHELYCAGHFIEGAVAYYRSTGKDKVLGVAQRLADHIRRQFGPNPDQKPGYPGHEEIELALVKLYRVTGQARYLELSKFFIDERGRKPYFFEAEALARGASLLHRGMWDYRYNQAHLPVREQDTVEGHAVRAMYLYAAMVDVAQETADPTLLEACRRLWQSLVQRQMYITGGIGSSDYGEAFTFDYDLPSDRAYAETCAAIGLVFWAQRMFNAEMKGQYMDVLEKALYNGVLSGISLDGRSFFYVNPLEVWPEASAKRQDTKHVKPARQKWFACACCPPNVARLLASLGYYAYSQGDDSLYVNLYMGSEIDFSVAGQNISLAVDSAYPWREEITLRVFPEEDSARFTLGLRIPGWCRNPQLALNGQKIAAAANCSDGYVKLDRIWQKGDRLQLILPMPVERIKAHPRVRDAMGKVALQRGPIVYCLEEADNGPNLPAIALARDTEWTVAMENEFLPSGIPVIYGKGLRLSDVDWQSALYRPAGEEREENVAIKAIPYFLWSNRQPGEMLVWIREK